MPGLWSNPRAQSAVDCGEMTHEDVREETGGKYLWRKTRQPRRRGNTAESQVGGGAIPVKSLSPHAGISS